MIIFSGTARGWVEGGRRPAPSRPPGAHPLHPPVVSAPIYGDIVGAIKTNRPYLIATHVSAPNRCLLAGSRWSWQTGDFFFLPKKIFRDINPNGPGAGPLSGFQERVSTPRDLTSVSRMELCTAQESVQVFLRISHSGTLGR